MADSRFFIKHGPFTLGRLAEMTGSELSDPVAADKLVEDVAPLATAGAAHVSFLDNKKYTDDFRATGAAACFVRAELAGIAPAATVCLLNDDPYRAYAVAATAFYPDEPVVASVAPSAVIAADAVIADGCDIGAHVVIGAGVKIGAGTRIGAGTVIAKGVEIGAGCDIAPRVSISHSLIGNNVRIHAGAVIGSPGFGFAMGKDGFMSVPQLGRVIVGDGADIGANTTIDRGAGPDTVIGAGTRIDNLVQIGHNVKIGNNCVIVAQTGISGSTEFGDFVVTAGQTGFAGHLKIGSGARIGAQSGIMRDVPAGVEIMGSPAVPVKQFMRQTAIVARMASKKGKE